VLFALGLAVSAHAADGVSADDDAKARTLFRQGDAAYAEGRYEDALRAFEEAHRLSRRPALLFNVGNALERLGKLGPAADALERYLPHAKRGEHDTLEKRIHNLRKRAAPSATIELEEEPPPAPPPVEPHPTPVEPDRVQRPPPAPASERGGDTTLGWVLIGAGTATAAAGVTFGFLALAARKDADAGCKKSGGQTLCSADARDARDRDQRYSLLADVGVGVGLLAGALGTYFLIDAATERGAARAAPRLRAGVHLHAGGGALHVGGEL
jgi:tetratricopeptide (TPR) repeat protein